jgi:hypothetical protein
MPGLRRRSRGLLYMYDNYPRIACLLIQQAEYNIPILWSAMQNVGYYPESDTSTTSFLIRLIKQLIFSSVSNISTLVTCQTNNPARQGHNPGLLPQNTAQASIHELRTEILSTHPDTCCSSGLLLVCFLLSSCVYSSMECPWPCYNS